MFLRNGLKTQKPVRRGIRLAAKTSGNVACVRWLRGGNVQAVRTENFCRIQKRLSDGICEDLIRGTSRLNLASIRWMLTRLWHSLLLILTSQHGGEIHLQSQRRFVR